LGTEKWDYHGQPNYARRDENRGVGTGNHSLQAFDQRLHVLDARPNPKIAAFDLTQDAVKSPRQVTGELSKVERRIAQMLSPLSPGEALKDQLAGYWPQIIRKTRLGMNLLQQAFGHRQCLEELHQIPR